MADVNTAETVPPSQSGANSAFKGFAFSKTSSAKPKLPVKSEKPQGEKIERLDKDAVPEAPVELVIPLRETVQWRPMPSGTKDQSNDAEKTSERATEDDLAASEILADLGKEKAKQGAEVDSIPLLMRNRVPGSDRTNNDEEILKLDIHQRPDEASLEDYERVPIEAFGAALLRGMGWKEGEALGSGKFKGLAEPVEYVPKFGRGGLGAGPTKDIEPPKVKKYIKPGESRVQKVYAQCLDFVKHPILMTLKDLVAAPGEDGRVRHVKKVGEELVERKVLDYERGVGVRIISGPHEGLYGRIASAGLSDCDVKLAISGETVRISQKRLELLEEREYKNKRHLVDEARDASEKSAKKHKSDSSSKAHKTHQSSTSHKSSGPSSRPWLRSGIRVRVISKGFKQGKYYNSKVVVEDVSSPTECICRTDDGRILEGLSVDMLETVIPRSSDAKIIVLRGPHSGQIARIVDRDSERSVATVQTLVDKEALRVSYDDISEYLGPVMDYLE